MQGILYGGPLPSFIHEAKQSLGDYFIESLRSQSDQVILVDGSSGKEITGLEILTKSIKIATILRSTYNIKSDDVIGLVIENRAEFFYIIIATFLIGATITLINPTYNEREFIHILGLSRPKIIFTSNGPSNIIKKLMKINKFIDWLIIFDYGNLELSKNIQSYDYQFSGSEIMDINDFRCTPTTMKEHISIIVTSSGTTGMPKGVQLSEWNVFITILLLSDRIKVTKKTSVLSSLPLFHAYGCFTSLTVLISDKMKYIFLANFKDTILLNCIEKYQVSYLLTVPPVLVHLSKTNLLKKYDLTSLTVIFSGAAPLNRQLIETILQLFPGIKLFQGFGMSETTLSVTIQTDEFCKPGSVGVLRTGVWGKVINPDTGETLGSNEKGELLFKGEVIMNGYIGDVEASKYAIDKDGWLHTGDIGYYDENGEWFIVDRIKELIKYKGYQVAPSELETILLTHSQIKDVAVIGRPDELAGELPMAFIVQHTHGRLTEKDVKDYVADKVSYTKQLRGGVEFIEEIPKNQTGKILRRVLKERLNKKAKL